MIFLQEVAALIKQKHPVLERWVSLSSLDEQSHIGVSLCRIFIILQFLQIVNSSKSATHPTVISSIPY